MDLTNYDENRYPLVRDCRYTETLLGPGDLLYIPRWHWHFITAISETEAAENFPLAYAQRCAAAAQNTGKGSGDRANSQAIRYEPSGRENLPIQHGLDPHDRQPPPQQPRDVESRRAYEYSFSVNFWWGLRILKG